MKTTLFQRKDFTMHSGGIARYKIECDSLNDEDIDTLAWIVAQKVKEMTGKEQTGIKAVHGVPRGGARFAQALEKYTDVYGSVNVIVDDVHTTGQSMENAKQILGWGDAIGIVIFSRGRCADWIKPIFSMNWFNTSDTFTNEI